MDHDEESTFKEQDGSQTDSNERTMEKANDEDSDEKESHKADLNPESTAKNQDDDESFK